MNPYLRIGASIAAAYVASTRVVTSTRAKWIAALLVGTGAYLAIPLILDGGKKKTTLGRSRVEYFQPDEDEDCGCDG